MVAQRKQANERLMTEAEYLAFEETALERHEFVDDKLRLMSGTTGAHNDIMQNFVLKLARTARSKNHQLYVHSVKLRARRSLFYPDVMLLDSRNAHTSEPQSNPIMIAEVFSDENVAIVRGEKLADYTNIPTLEQYVLVNETQRKVEIYERSMDAWTYRFLEGDGSFNVPCIGARMTLDDVYDGVTFPKPKRRGPKQKLD